MMYDALHGLARVRRISFGLAATVAVSALEPGGWAAGLPSASSGGGAP
jgi:hypothetical protein